VVRAVRRWYLIFVVILIIVPVATYTASSRRDKQYDASASLLFRDPGFDQRLFGTSALPPSQDAAREAATNLQLVSLRGVAERAAKKLGTGITGPMLAKRITVNPAGQSNVVTVTARALTPAAAAAEANAVANEYISFRRGADQAKIDQALTLVNRQRDALGQSRAGSREGTSLSKRAEELSVLRALQTGNAEFVERAVPPREASTPNVAQDTVVGSFAGLLLALMVVLARSRIDKRLRDDDEVREIFDWPIVSSIRRSPDIGKRAGQPLVLRDPEAFALLRANLQYFNVNRDIRSVVVTSGASGDGKSTVAWNLAVAASRGGQRTLLIEADLRQTSKFGGYGRGSEPGQGLSEVLAGGAPWQSAVIEVGTSAGGPDEYFASVLPAGRIPPNPADLLNSTAMRSLLASVSTDYDLVVVDTAPISTISDAIPLLLAASGTIIVARLGVTTRAGSVRLRTQLDNLSAPVLGVVINCTADRLDDYGYGYADPSDATKSIPRSELRA
jgi:capsular exopolysaccharide synthesis family protein